MMMMEGCMVIDYFVEGNAEGWSLIKTYGCM